MRRYVTIDPTAVASMLGTPSAAERVESIVDSAAPTGRASRAAVRAVAWASAASGRDPLPHVPVALRAASQPHVGAGAPDGAVSRTHGTGRGDTGARPGAETLAGTTAGGPVETAYGAVRVPLTRASVGSALHASVAADARVTRDARADVALAAARHAWRAAYARHVDTVASAAPDLCPLHLTYTVGCDACENAHAYMYAARDLLRRRPTSEAEAADPGAPVRRQSQFARVPSIAHARNGADARSDTSGARLTYCAPDASASPARPFPTWREHRAMSGVAVDLVDADGTVYRCTPRAAVADWAEAARHRYASGPRSAQNAPVGSSGIDAAGIALWLRARERDARAATRLTRANRKRVRRAVRAVAEFFAACAAQ